MTHDHPPDDGTDYSYWTIETRSQATGMAWRREVGTQNVFDFASDADQAVCKLRTLGPDWAAADYRVVPYEPDPVPVDPRQLALAGVS